MARRSASIACVWAVKHWHSGARTGACVKKDRKELLWAHGQWGAGVYCIFSATCAYCDESSESFGIMCHRGLVLRFQLWSNSSEAKRPMAQRQAPDWLSFHQEFRIVYREPKIYIVSCIFVHNLWYHPTLKSWNVQDFPVDYDATWAKHRKPWEASWGSRSWVDIAKNEYLAFHYSDTWL